MSTEQLDLLGNKSIKVHDAETGAEILVEVSTIKLVCGMTARHIRGANITCVVDGQYRDHFVRESSQEVRFLAGMKPAS